MAQEIRQDNIPTPDENYLVGKLLLAMPGMTDPRFERAVIFMCAHDDKGAMGLVINHKMPDLKFDQLITQLGVTSDIEVALPPKSVPVMSGGPVENARGFLLHSSDFRQSDTIRIDDSFSVTGTVEALKKVASGHGPEQLLFILGYAGWGPEQLEQEILQNAWLVVDPDPGIIFHDNPDQKWTMAIGKLGIDPAMLSDQVGRA
jgi:putative transcriptional regulator